MTVVRHPNKSRSSGQRRPLIIIFLILFNALVYLAVTPDKKPNNNNDGSNNNKPSSGGGFDSSSMKQKSSDLVASLKQNLRRSKMVRSVAEGVAQRREQFRKAFKSYKLDKVDHIPARLQKAREHNEIVGERLSEIREGSETVEEILHATHKSPDISDKPPMELNEIITFIDNWIHQLHNTLIDVKRGTYEEIWQAYHDITVQTLYPWDRDYLSRMPKRRDDDSIFMSIATYRDENCLNTMTWAYEKAMYPERLYVGLVQQNCHHDCKSGVMKNGKTQAAPPDPDCYKLFCASDIGKPHCQANRIRKLDIDESESLGPYAARYFASKMWYGEQWYMQIDAHMTFSKHWDARSINMLQNAPSKKPVISHYPPGHEQDLELLKDKAGSRLCGPIFATSDLENQIIRLEGSRVWDTKVLETPRFAPFTAAGYFVAHSSMLADVPFDPFLPWIFMGEEIIMSSRLWTSGYDIFSPSHSVLGHMYVRRNKPKFWESVHRAFTYGIHNNLQMLVLDRIKHQLGYPEAAIDMLPKKSILTAVEQYSMGTERSLDRYLRMVGLNMTTKEVHYTAWCETGQTPPGMEQYALMYEDQTV